MLRAARARPFPMSAWCSCMLHAPSVQECSASRPSWLRQYTGTAGEVQFRLQDWAWGNTMMALRDSLAIAIVLNRRPVLLITPGQPPLNGADLSSVFDLHAITIVSESNESRRELKPPPGVARVLRAANDLRAELERPRPASEVLYSKIISSMMADHQKGLLQLARQYSGRAAWAELFTAPVPDCWSAAFLRPAARVRAAALQLASGSYASAHLRLCSLLGWRDTCTPLRQPHDIARSILRCAVRAHPSAPGGQAASLFVASDSAVVLDALRRDSSSGNLSLSGDGALRSVTLSTVSSSLGAASHLSRQTGRRDVDAQVSLDRAVFDWAAFAYSQRVVSLPSSFSASAVCMFHPAMASFVVYKRPAEASGEVDCERPLSSSVGGGTHPCNDLLRINWGGTPSRKVPPVRHVVRRGARYRPKAKTGGGRKPSRGAQLKLSARLAGSTSSTPRATLRRAARRPTSRETGVQEDRDESDIGPW